MNYTTHQGRSDSLEVHTFTAERSNLGLHLSPAINRHSGVSQAKWFINVCTIPQMNAKLGIQPSSICWWMLKIPQFPLWRGGELSPSPWKNKWQIPALIYRGAQLDPQADHATHSHGLHTKEKEEERRGRRWTPLVHPTVHNTRRLVSSHCRQGCHTLFTKWLCIGSVLSKMWC